MREWSDRAQDVLTVILGGGRGTRLHPLTVDRSKPAVPVGGKYRLIDIPISNAIHSDMSRVLLLTQFNSVSLHRHIALTYRFDNFSRGYVQLLAAQQTPGNERWFQGTADAVRQNLRLIRGIPGDTVLILSGDHIYLMDYRLLLREHVESGADITLAVLPCSERDIAGFGAVRVDDAGRVVEFREKPRNAEERSGMEVARALRESQGVPEDKPYLASMGIYLFRKEVLVQVLANEYDDFGRDIIPRCTHTRHVRSFFFNGYWRDIGTIRSFYDTHMDLVGSPPLFDVHRADWPIYTRPRYLPPARIDACGFTRVMLAEGGDLRHCTIEDSVVGVRARAASATIRRSLVMGIDADPAPSPAGAPPPGIGEGTVIERAIIDKNARIGRDCRIVNAAGVEEAEGPGWCIRDGIVVVMRNGVIPDGTEI